MSGLSLSRNNAPAEVDGIPDDLASDMKAWAKAWPAIEREYADFKRTVQGFINTNRSLNQEAGRKARDRSLSSDQKKALQELITRTSATHDALERLI